MINYIMSYYINNKWHNYIIDILYYKYKISYENQLIPTKTTKLYTMLHYISYLPYSTILKYHI